MPPEHLDTRISDADDAAMLEEAYAVNNAHDFLTKHEVGDMASEYIEAHGSRMTVAEGIATCPPFARSITGIAERMAAKGRSEEVISDAVRSMIEENVENAPSTSIADLTGSEKK